MRMKTGDSGGRPGTGSSAYRARGAKRRGPQRMIPLLFFAIIAAMVIRDKVPAVDAWVTRLISPDKWQAMVTCQQAALSGADRPEFARLLAIGRAYETEGGYVVKHVETGQMDTSGDERRSAYTCYLDRDFQLVRIKRN